MGKSVIFAARLRLGFVGDVSLGALPAEALA